MFILCIHGQLVCLNETDASIFVYKICAIDFSCRQLYDIPFTIVNLILEDLGNVSNSEIDENNSYFNFLFQIEALELFIPFNTSINYFGGLYSLLWPQAWIDEVNIIYYGGSTNMSVSCSNLSLINNITEDTFSYIPVILDILKMYKTFISMDDRCNNINEKLVLDIQTSRFKCVCLEGKVCDQNSQINILLSIIAGFSAILAIIMGCVSIYHSIVGLKKLDEYSYLISLINTPPKKVTEKI